MDLQTSKFIKSLARGARSKVAKAKRTYTCRTLKELIKAYRACTTHAEERALVKKESAHIRDLFKEGDTTFRRRNIAKLLFFHMNGYPTDFGMTECVKLCASPKFPDKRVAYLGLMILVEETEDILILVTNALKRDLASDDQHIVALALTVLADLASADMARDLLPEIEMHVESATSVYIRRKASLAAVRAVRKLPAEETPNLLVAVPRLFQSPHAPAHIAASALVISLARQSPGNLPQLRATGVPAILAALHDLLRPTNRSAPSSANVVGGVRNPFLQVKVLHAVRVIAHGAPRHLLAPISDALARIAANTDVSTTLGTAVMYECVRTIVSLDTEPSLRALAVGALCKFLIHKDANVRYIALQELVKVVSAGNGDENMEEYRATITKALLEPDPSIRLRALELLHAIVGGGNAVEIAAELLAFLGRTADEELRESAVRKICDIIARFSPSPEWRVDIFLQALEEVDAVMPESLISAFIAWISTVDSVQSHVAGKVYALCLLPSGGRSSGNDAPQPLPSDLDPFESMMSGAVIVAPTIAPAEVSPRGNNCAGSVDAEKVLPLNRRRARFERVCAYIFGEYGDSLVDQSAGVTGAVSEDDAISALERLLTASGVDVTSFPSSALLPDHREDVLLWELRLVRETCMTALVKLAARFAFASSASAGAGGGLGSLGASVAASAGINSSALFLEGPSGLLALEDGSTGSGMRGNAQQQPPAVQDSDFGTDLLAGLGISDNVPLGLGKPAEGDRALAVTTRDGMDLLDYNGDGDSLLLGEDDVGVHPALIRVRRIFAKHRQSSDAETQQRACEYSGLLTGNMASLRSVVFPRLPAMDYDGMWQRQKQEDAASFSVDVDGTGAQKPFSEDLLLLLDDDATVPQSGANSGMLALPPASGGFDLDDILNGDSTNPTTAAEDNLPFGTPTRDALPEESPVHISALPSGRQPVAPPTTLFSDWRLTVTALFFKDTESSPGTTRAELTYSNSGTSDISKFIFQLSVPKYIQSDMKPASSSSIQVGSSASQALFLENSMHGVKPVQLRFRMQFVVDGENMVEQGTCAALQLPPGL